MITVFGGLALLVGFIMVYTVTGTNSISSIIEQSDKIAESNLFIFNYYIILDWCIYKVSTVSLPHMVTEGRGCTYTSKCLFTLCNNG